MMNFTWRFLWRHLCILSFSGVYVVAPDVYVDEVPDVSKMEKCGNARGVRLTHNLCFYVLPNATFYEAQTSCMERRGLLYHFTISAESLTSARNIRRSLFAKTNETIWLGVSHVRRFGVFETPEAVVVPGSLLELDAHEATESNVAQFRCFKWRNDTMSAMQLSPCDQKMRALCVASIGPVCRSGGVLLREVDGDNCYFLTRGRSTHSKARAYCHAHSGELVSWYSRSQERYVAGKLGIYVATRPSTSLTFTENTTVAEVSFHYWVCARLVGHQNWRWKCGTGSPVDPLWLDAPSTDGVKSCATCTAYNRSPARFGDVTLAQMVVAEDCNQHFYGICVRSVHA